jgi:hypothetical protein
MVMGGQLHVKAALISVELFWIIRLNWRVEKLQGWSG